MVLACIYAISWPILHASDRLITRIGEGKVGITRVLGIILAALAVQYVFNGITGYYDWLAGGRGKGRRDDGTATLAGDEDSNPDDSFWRRAS